MKVWADRIRSISLALCAPLTLDNSRIMSSVRSDMLKWIAAVGVLVWLTMFLFLYAQLNTNSSGESIRAWRQTKEAIDKLQEQNDNLKIILEKERTERNDQHKRILEQSHQLPPPMIGPVNQEVVREVVFKPDVLGSVEQEVHKRMLDDRIREMFYLLHSQSIENSTKTLMENQMHSLMALSGKLEKLEGSEKERVKRRAQIAERILKSIKKLQNPDSCENAKDVGLQFG
ncbi:unnamed protein product [Caenorhabditis sp. 36 PRJEB53466]|nr:unnamed protein product [Caenorhabditis sp. 36 PRJEB53466]